MRDVAVKRMKRDKEKYDAIVIGANQDKKEAIKATTHLGPHGALAEQPGLHFVGHDRRAARVARLCPAERHDALAAHGGRWRPGNRSGNICEKK